MGRCAHRTAGACHARAVPHRPSVPGAACLGGPAPAPEPLRPGESDVPETDWSPCRPRFEHGTDPASGVRVAPSTRPNPPSHNKCWHAAAASGTVFHRRSSVCYFIPWASFHFQWYGMTEVRPISTAHGPMRRYLAELRRRLRRRMPSPGAGPRPGVAVHAQVPPMAPQSRTECWVLAGTMI